MSKTPAPITNTDLEVLTWAMHAQQLEEASRFFGNLWLKMPPGDASDAADRLVRFFDSKR